MSGKTNTGHTYSGNSRACAPSTSHFSLIFYTMQLDGNQGGKRPASNSLLHSPVPGTFCMDIPQTTPFSSILLFSTSLTPTSYFSSHMWEIPPPFILACSLLLRLWRSWSILSESICGKWRMDRIILTFGSVYIYVLLLFLLNGSPEGQREMWFHV